MARPRKPTKLHVINGTFDHNPARAREREAEPIDNRPLGPPPESMSAPQRAAWMEIERLAPWLAQADRLAVEITAMLVARFRQAQDLMQPALLTRLETMLGRLGLTPSDRSKVQDPGAPKKGNRFADRGKRPA